MKNNFNYILCLGLIVSISFVSCQSKEKKRSAKPWPEIIKEIRYVVSAHHADSVRCHKLNAIFEHYNLTLKDYREFHQVYFENNPSKSLSLLKEVEQAISEDMRKETENDREQQRNKFEKRNRRIIESKDDDS